MLFLSVQIQFNSSLCLQYYKFYLLTLPRILQHISNFQSSKAVQIYEIFIFGLYREHIIKTGTDSLKNLVNVLRYNQNLREKLKQINKFVFTFLLYVMKDLW